MSSNSTVLVVGSANMDYIVKVVVPPAPGETVLAKALVKHAGGKGANQAVAAARMGAKVRFVGCVGDDRDGENLLRALRQEGVDAAAVEIAAHEQTGLALVSVFQSGENSITVVPGANYALHANRVRRAIGSDTLPPVVVLQAEIRPEVIHAAIDAAAEAHSRIVLNLAPYQAMPEATLSFCDPLIVNESEAAAMVGFPVSDLDSAQRALKVLRDSVRSAVITMGAQGACWSDSSGEGLVGAPTVDAVVDTTGAGDAFVGALAAELSAGASLEQATTVGVEAGSFAVGRFGAQSSYPMRDELGSVTAGHS
ncbi:ribokinase [Paenarthrobacter sp. OM7]|uniref:ribokinase n=1 Tax=Paenarthrobacter sp. OM7 TaxID=3041264 RepID=UPI0024684F7C|nr:ribokinase [Paenarthrobacter sp. OM7]WGM20276.1 ribokinase [Paenarthrobacter sp. OM7]